MSVGGYGDFLYMVGVFVESVEAELDIHEDGECMWPGEVYNPETLEKLRARALRLEEDAAKLGLLRTAQQLRHVAGRIVDRRLCGRDFLWLYSIAAEEIASSLDTLIEKIKAKKGGRQ